MKDFFDQRIVLGSGSPRRKEILELAGIDFEIIQPDIDESVSADMPPEEVPVYLSEQKALAIQERIQDKSKPILTADTIVTIDGEVLGKPTDREDAIAILSKLSGRQHQVISGVCLLKGADKLLVKDVTRVSFSRMTIDEIIHYVDTYQPYDKAGAYAIQEWVGVRFISSIEGCYYNVMGLPIARVLQQISQ